MDRVSDRLTGRRGYVEEETWVDGQTRTITCMCACVSGSPQNGDGETCGQVCSEG